MENEETVELIKQLIEEKKTLITCMEGIGKKLDRVLAYIDKVESPEYQRSLDNKEMLINLLANAVITRLFAMFNNGQNQTQ